MKVRIPMFTDDFKAEPFWWDAAPRPADTDEAVPERTEVAVIGSGYTGLHAALQTARGGRDTLVLDAQSAGYGCSSRNGGQVSTSIKPSLGKLARSVGEQTGFRIRREGIDAMDYLADFIEGEQIDCRWARVGRFHGAHQPARYEEIARDVANQPKGLEVEAHVVPRHEQRDEIGSDLYHGGVVYPQHAALHPGLYHLGILDRVRQAKARVISHCPVNAIERDGGEFVLLTSKGKVRARDVVVATNGYTGPLSPWHRRRVIPIGSYMIATEPLGANLMQVISPRARVMSDSRKLVFYYRSCPDRERILFGGRVALKETDPRVSAPRLHAAMTQIFPDLAQTRISHSWAGFVAYTFDALPHIGVHQGLHYAMGYCGSGVSLASYFGMRIGQKVLGLSEGESALEGVPFQTRPLYTGDPWFLAPSLLYYKLRDRLNL